MREAVDLERERALVRRGPLRVILADRGRALALAAHHLLHQVTLARAAAAAAAAARLALARIVAAPPVIALVVPVRHARDSPFIRGWESESERGRRALVFVPRSSPRSRESPRRRRSPSPRSGWRRRAVVAAAAAAAELHVAEADELAVAVLENVTQNLGVAPSKRGGSIASITASYLRAE